MPEFKPFEMVARIEYGGAVADGDVMQVCMKPTFIQPLVRCKDCKWFKEGLDIDGKHFTRCNRLVRTYGYTPPDWFCADGERKDGAE